MHKSKKRIVFYVVIGFIVVLFSVLAGICSWITKNLGIELNELIYALISPLKGSNTSIVKSCAQYCVPIVLLTVVGVGAISVIDYWLGKKNGWKQFKILRWGMLVGSLVVVILCSKYIDTNMKVIDYIKARLSSTTIYEEYYVDPDEVKIYNNGDKKNLICIYLESMENSYAAVDDGGAQVTNYIPNLTALAKQNISFSQTDKLGGFSGITGATWTMGALFATTTGIPFSFPTAPNSMDQREKFASGVTSLGDILQHEGYLNEFLCGSDCEFGGRESYFVQHGNYEIFDLSTAREEGYIEKDYHVWWGFEDEILYRIAKDELLELAESGQPFNFTMLTADTHYPDGYVCGLCQEEYDEVAANVVACADRQLAEFVEWCQQQDFYESTVIVIIGDHPRMDKALVEGLVYSEREIYNCFINCDLTENVQLNNRVVTTVDIFPTVLAALGYEIEGNRLGLGTNLFSNEQTLTEIMGYEQFNQEIAKYSDYYLKNFS